MYAMVATRPDLAFAVSAVGQFASNPQKGSLECDRPYPYLRGSAEYALVYSEEGILAVSKYIAADWGENLPDRGSTSGNVFTLGNTAMSWTSTRQKSVGSGLSSTEAEYKKRTKHIDIAYHFVRECVANGTISVEYIPTDDMTADVLTKALPQIKHEKHIRAMGLGPVSSAKRGEN
jgi:hypothetical protein